MKKIVYGVEMEENLFNDGYPDDYDFGQHLHDSDYIDDGMGEVIEYEAERRVSRYGNERTEKEKENGKV